MPKPWVTLLEADRDMYCKRDFHEILVKDIVGVFRTGKVLIF